MRARSVILAVMLTVVPGRAYAMPIGTFDWVYDSFFGFGSTFSVNNESDDLFLGTYIDLFAPEASTPFYTIALGDIAGGGSSQSIEDLSFLFVPFDLDHSQLRLTYGTALITADLFASDLVGDPASLLSASININAPDPPNPDPVPEPSTLLLLSSGMAAFAYRARSRARLRGVPR